MKILLIIPSFYPATIYGGPIFSTLHTCQELAKLDDVEVFVSTTNANMTNKLDVETGVWKKFIDNLFVKYYNTTMKHTISIPMYFSVWKDMKNTDLVHIQSVYNVSTPFSLLYAWLLHKPILLSPRGQFGGWCFENGSNFKNLWLSLLIKPFKESITWHATAKKEKEDIALIFKNSKVEVIPNGIEYELFQKSTVLEKNEYLTKFTQAKMSVQQIIVSMGRLQKVKGFDILIDSFTMILKEYPNAKLLIAGDDEGEKQNLLKQIKQLGLERKAFLVGVVNGQDKIDFLANADLFVLPSHSENFGNVFVESLAAGTPIIASRGTPWSEVEEADCGKWVNNSVIETANAMLEMLRKDRKKMRENSKKLAKKYDWKNIALQFKEVFERVINR